MMQGFEWFSPSGGLFWKQFEAKLEGLAQIGITAVWLPPPTKASSPEGNGYDVYVRVASRYSS